MSKIFSKTLKKTTLLSVVLAVLLAAAIVVGALFGFNKSVTMDDNATLTVSVNTFAYNNDKDAITKTCEKAFDGAKVSAEYVVEGEMNGDSCELIFVFDKNVDTAALKDSVKAALIAQYPDEDTRPSFNVSAAAETAVAVLAKHFLLRAAIAAAVFAVLAIVYVAVRYASVWTGLAVGASVFLSMALTVGLILLTRIPVTVSTASVVAVAGLLTAVSALLTLGKVRSASKDSEESVESILSSSIAAKETLLLSGGLAAAMLLVGILGKTTAAWYAVAAFVAIAVAALISLFYAPALYLSAKKIEGDKSKSGYVGAKKGGKKAKVSQEVESVEESTEA